MSTFEVIPISSVMQVNQVHLIKGVVRHQQIISAICHE